MRSARSISAGIPPSLLPLSVEEGRPDSVVPSFLDAGPLEEGVPGWGDGAFPDLPPLDGAEPFPDVGCPPCPL